ncbi:MAG TPA: J domain-containing protein [Lysobacter sp.]|nr:J domain-containing protein [Lysobacter sp.]
MSPHRFLDLSKDATEAEIKRAYARLLKQHRPDVDPTGFQRLHEAYTRCLEHARYRMEYGDDDYDEDEDEDETDLTAPADALAMAEADATEAAIALDTRLRSAHAGHADSAERIEVTLDDMGSSLEDELWEEVGREPAFDFDGFIDDLIQRVHSTQARDLADWLHGQQALYSLQLKQMLSAPVAHALAEAAPLPDEERVQVVMTFFGLDGLGQQHGWIERSIQRLWQRLEDRRGFDRVLAEYQSPRTKPVDRMLLRELITPRNWLRFLAILLCPFLPSRTRSLLLMLEDEGRDAAKARLNHDTANFWRRAADPERLDWRRALIVLLRVVLLVLPVAAYVMFLTNNSLSFAPVAAICGTAALAWFAWTSLSLAWRRLNRWNRETLQWDMPLVLAGLVVAMAVTTGFFASSWSVPLSILTLVFWLAQRNGDKYYAAFGAACFGAGLVALALALLKQADKELGALPFDLGAAYGAVSVIAHDVFYSRRRQIPLSEARAKMGWLVWLLLIHI